MATSAPRLISQESASAATQTLKQSAIAFIVLDTVFVLLRTVSRVWFAKLKFGWDDFWILPAYVLNLACCAIGLYMQHYETIGNPPDAVITNPATLEPLLKCIYAVVQFVIPGYTLTRYSILALYLRIFTGRYVRWATWFCIVGITCSWIAYAFAAFFMCSPVSYFWNKAMMPPGSCIDINLFFRAFTPPNIVFDVLIIVIPIPTVWQLKASRTRKLGLTFLFSIGIIALVATILRYITYLHTTSTVIAPSYTNSLISWIIIEPGIYLIAACLPAMHHLLVFLTPQPLRNMTDRGIARARAKNGGEPSVPFSGKRNSTDRLGLVYNNNFTRLADSNEDPETRAIAESTSQNSLRSKVGKPDVAMDVEDGRGGGQGGMGMVEQGDGIIMRTEITVTQEEKIQDVLGF